MGVTSGKKYGSGHPRENLKKKKVIIPAKDQVDFNRRPGGILKPRLERTVASFKKKKNTRGAPNRFHLSEQKSEEKTSRGPSQPKQWGSQNPQVGGGGSCSAQKGER